MRQRHRGGNLDSPAGVVRRLGRGSTEPRQTVEKPGTADIAAADQPGRRSNHLRSGPGTRYWSWPARAALLMTRPGPVLRRNGPSQERPGHVSAELYPTGILCVQWVIIGYSLAFGSDGSPALCGGWQWIGLRGVGLDPNPVSRP